MAKKQEIKALQAKWYKILKKDGFNDLENVRNGMKSWSALNINTARFHDREAVLEFFLKLDSYLSHTKNIKPLHRKILELYSAGLYHQQIADKVNRTKHRIRQILAQHKPKISAFIP